MSEFPDLSAGSADDGMGREQLSSELFFLFCALSVFCLVYRSFTAGFAGDDRVKVHLSDEGPSNNHRCIS